MGRKKIFTNQKKMLKIRKKFGNKVEVAVTAEKNSHSAEFRRIKSASLPEGWIEMNEKSADTLIFCNMQLSNNLPVISHSLVVKKDLTYKLNIYTRKEVTLPKNITISSPDDVTSLMLYISSLVICPGNPDKSYILLANERENVFKNRQGDCVAILETEPVQTVRHSNCKYLQEKRARCTVCSDYRHTLNSLKSKDFSYQRKSNDISIQTNLRWLSKEQMSQEIRDLRSTVHKQEQLIAKLQEKIEKDNTAVSVNELMDSDLITTMRQHHEEILKKYPENSFQLVFWQNQYQNTMQKSRKHFRWHPTMIKWCIFLRHKSSSAYELLRSSNVINLPSQRTLRDYTYYYKSTSGFSAELDKQLITDSKVETLEEHQKQIGLIADEMYIKEDLVYCKNTGDLIGFCDIGDINNHLSKLEAKYNNQQENNHDSNIQAPTLAKTMLVIMIRGICTHFTFPYASFPSTNLTGEQLLPIFLEAITRLETCGFKVTTITLDGNSVNRRFFKLIGDNSGTVKHKFNNPLSENKRCVYLFSDPPHLIKTTRNCLANPKRQMKFQGKSVSWDHVKKLYEMTITNNGLTTLPKLKHEHIYLNNYSKMRVDLAAQTLSSTVANAIRLFLEEDAEETAVFIERFNKFFDILNVRNYSEFVIKRNYDKSPYRWGQDKRLEWLESVFLPWLKEWETEAKEHKEMKAEERNKLMLSTETLLGIRITALSFIDLVKYLFTIQNVKSFLSEKTSQDPLEKYFGRQRQRGKSNENPSAHEFLINNQALRVVNSIRIDTSRGNTRGTNLDGITTVSDGPLQKRRRCNTASNHSVTAIEDSLTDLIPTSINDAITLTSIVAKSVTSDLFQISTLEANKARKTALDLYKWLSENKTVAEQYNNIFTYFYNIWTSLQPTNHTIREQVWQRFLSFTSSVEYSQIWSSLYSLANITVTSSILSFHVTYSFFIAFWKKKYPVEIAEVKQPKDDLTKDEEYALWYVGGYLIRKIKDKIGVKNEKVMAILLEDIDEDEDNDDDDSGNQHHPKEWLDLINRGGLTKCSNDFYEHLLTVEKETQKVIMPTARNIPLTKTTETVSKSQIVQESWYSITAVVALEREDSDRINELIIYEFLKVRCFGHVNKLLEIYKSQKKTNLQKSRGLRASLIDTY